MTLPEQSERAVAATREFLVRLSSPFVEGGIKGIRREVRAEALALLRHYPYAWNGDCPEQDNAANEDNLLAEVRRLRSAIAALADQDATLSVCEGSVIVTMDATLTKDERKAVGLAVEHHMNTDEPKDNAEPSGASGGYPAVARRYVLLGGEAYYAAGGFNDFLSSHDTLEGATTEAAWLEGLKDFECIDWWHVWDCVSNSVVAKSGTQAYGANDSGPTLDGLRNG